MQDHVRYAVVGLGHIAQSAVLPAFAHAHDNSRIAALVSGDPEKLRVLGERYRVPPARRYNYLQYEECLRSGAVDAVYIATPNTEHQRYTELAAAHKVHVLCEKPMAIDESACLSMLQLARGHGVKLMIAYRLHFDPANLRASEVAQSGELGQLRSFNSIFTMQISDPHNIRLKKKMGGGPLYDIGIYCINAARSLFRGEPIAAFAMNARSLDSRFQEVDESVTALLKFPDERVATFCVSFGSEHSSAYDLIGTEGRLRLSHAYDYTSDSTLTVCHGEKNRKEHFAKRDQFGPELVYFSDCIINNREPEPSDVEGWADVRVIQALQRSIQCGSLVQIPVTPKKLYPSIAQEIVRPPVEKAPLVNVHPPSQS